MKAFMILLLVCMHAECTCRLHYRVILVKENKSWSSQRNDSRHINLMHVQKTKEIPGIMQLAQERFSYSYAVNITLSHAKNVLPPVLFTPHIRFVSSQTLQSLTKLRLKTINIYNIKYVYYKTTFHNESNNVDLALWMLIFFYKFSQSRDTLTLDKIYMRTQKDRREYNLNKPG